MLAKVHFVCYTAPMAKIRIRLRNGKLYDVKDAAFVELCNDENELAGLVYMTNSNVFKICYSTDPEFARYLAAYKGKGLPKQIIRLAKPSS